MEIVFWSLFSYSSNLLIDLVPVLNKIILIMLLLVTVLTQFKPHYGLVPVLNKIVLLTFIWSLFSHSSNLIID